MKHSPIMTLGFAACLLMIAGTLSADTVENPAGHRMHRILCRPISLLCAEPSKALLVR